MTLQWCSSALGAAMAFGVVAAVVLGLI